MIRPASGPGVPQGKGAVTDGDMERRLIRKQSADLMSHDPRRDLVSEPESSTLRPDSNWSSPASCAVTVQPNSSEKRSLWR